MPGSYHSYNPRTSPTGSHRGYVPRSHRMRLADDVTVSGAEDVDEDGEM